MGNHFSKVTVQQKICGQISAPEQFAQNVLHAPVVEGFTDSTHVAHIDTTKKRPPTSSYTLEVFFTRPQHSPLHESTKTPHISSVSSLALCPEQTEQQRPRQTWTNTTDGLHASRNFGVKRKKDQEEMAPLILVMMLMMKMAAASAPSAETDPKRGHGTGVLIQLQDLYYTVGLGVKSIPSGIPSYIRCLWVHTLTNTQGWKLEKCCFSIDDG